MDLVAVQVARASAPCLMDATNGSDLAVPERHEVWCLRLYVAGQSPKSLTAVANLKKLCQHHLPGRYHIETIDLVKDPTLARDDDVLAIPTLVRRLPTPLRKIIGDLSKIDGSSSFFHSSRDHRPDRTTLNHC